MINDTAVNPASRLGFAIGFSRWSTTWDAELRYDECALRLRLHVHCSFYLRVCGLPQLTLEVAIDNTLVIVLILIAIIAVAPQRGFFTASEHPSSSRFVSDRSMIVPWSGRVVVKMPRENCGSARHASRFKMVALRHDEAQDYQTK